MAILRQECGIKAIHPASQSAGIFDVGKIFVQCHGMPA